MTEASSGYNIAKVRELLLSAFTAEELRRFCMDSPTFRPIVYRFGTGHGLIDMVDEVVDYCDKRVLLAELLEKVREVNRSQFARFEPLLKVQEALEKAEIGLSSIEQRDLLEQELAQHQRNLALLQTKKAVYATGEEPLSLLNQMEHEKREIDRLRAELRRSPPSATTHE